MNTKLQQILGLPIRNIQDVRACFDYCSSKEEIDEVIRHIPLEFGDFDISKIDEREGYFMIQNFFKKDGGFKSEVTSYDFYTVKEDRYYDFRRR